MASWTNLPHFTPGTLLPASTLDQMLDNITVLSTHAHTGAVGDGSASLVNSKFTNSGIVTPYYLSHLSVPHMFPDSQNNWSNITVASQTDEPTLAISERTRISSCTLGASIAWTIRYSNPVAFFGIKCRFLSGPNSGCVGIYTGASLNKTVNLYFGSIALFETSVSIPGGTSASIQLKFVISGSDVGSTGYGASCIGISAPRSPT